MTIDQILVHWLQLADADEPTTTTDRKVAIRRRQARRRNLAHCVASMMWRLFREF